MSVGGFVRDFASCMSPGYLRALVEEHARRSRQQRAIRKFSEASVSVNAEVVNPERLTLGRGVIVQSGTVLHCGGLEWSGGKGHISIGDGCYIGHNCILYGAGEIEVGRHVQIAPGVIIASHGHVFDGPENVLSDGVLTFGRIEIEENVWIGSGAVIVEGVKIGERSVVAANATVVRDVEASTVVGGTPARELRRIA